MGGSAADDNEGGDNAN